MSEVIIYHEGAYNIYSSISDGPFFESGLTLDQLKQFIKDEYGTQGLRDLDTRLEKAHKNGSSGLRGSTLRETISSNAEGLFTEQFIQKYLTIRS